MNFVILNKDTPLQCSVGTDGIPGLNSRFTFQDFAEPESVAQTFRFIEGIVNNLAENFLETFTKVRFTVSASGVYYTQTGNASTTIFSPVENIYRHSLSRRDRVRTSLYGVFHPDHFHNGINDDSGFDEEYDGNRDSSLKYLVSIEHFSINFVFPIEFNANQLSPPKRLIPQLPISNHLSFIPYNRDHYCVLHTIYNRLSGRNSKTTGKSLSRDEEYCEAFFQWFVENKLSRFYSDQNFLLDKIEELEEQLKVSLNIFTFVDERLERHFQSSYRHSETVVLYLAIIPLHYFYNPNRQEGTLKGLKRVCEAVTPVESDPSGDFSSSISVKELVENSQAHCCELNLSWFSQQSSVCRYCTKPLDFRYTTDQHHETLCLKSFKSQNPNDRVKRFIQPKETVRKFHRFDSFYRVPFAVYDWETRIVTEIVDGVEVHRHVPFSYAILYLNIFDFTKSRILMKSSTDQVELLNSFLNDIRDTAHHHHGIQLVDQAEQGEKESAEIPQDSVCPWCRQVAQVFEYNHSHFEGDNKNLHLNRYICKGCNGKAKIRNKPLKFYAHNAAKFDNNLFVESLFNNASFRGFDFVAKNESRFNQITCNVDKIPISFCDSRLILPGPLAELASAWISPGLHLQNVETLLKIFYNDRFDGFTPKDFKSLAGISLKKAVFPYSALNQPDVYLSATDPLEREVFYDSLSREAVSEGNYGEYQKVHSLLKDVIPEYHFQDYHDFYLLLDVVLLANILYNFMESNFQLAEINPLAYMSSPSFSFNSLLKWNLHSDVKPIELPDVDTQLFIQKGIHGGFTFIFNKKNLQGPFDWTTYFDFTSMYPTVMAKSKLPHRHLSTSRDPTERELQSALDDEDRYYFLEVDIAPLAEEFHERNSILPLFPGAELVKGEYLSEDQLYRYEQNCGSRFKDVTINTVSFFAKKNYVASASYLREAIRLGYKIDKVHRIEKFEQDYVMKDYVVFLYQLKKELSIERDALKGTEGSLKKKLEVVKHLAPFFAKVTGTDVNPKRDYHPLVERINTASDKLAAVLSRLASVKVQLNAIYGFTITNVSRQTEVEMIDTKYIDKIRKRISSCRFKSLLVTGEKVLVNKQKSTYELSYPLMLGTAILYESKLLMTRFIYGIWDFLKGKSKPDFPLSFHPCMTDTDSYFFSIGNFKKYWSSIDHFAYEFNTTCFPVFDTSAHNDVSLQNPETHSELGFVTNETGGRGIRGFWGICSKVYSFTVDGDQDEDADVKAKGVSKAAKKKYLSHELYGKVVDGKIFEEERENLLYNYTQIQSTRTNLTNQECRKQMVTLVDIKSHYDTNGTQYSIFGSKKHLDAIRE